MLMLIMVVGKDCAAIKLLGGSQRQSEDQGKIIQHGIKKDIQKRCQNPVSIEEKSKPENQNKNSKE